LDVVYEDAYLMVVNKPAGLVVHPAPGNWQGTLLNGLLAHHAGAAMVPRAGIVHRLDKDTSGLMVVAKDRSTMDALVALIARRDVSRRYLALAHKPWKGAELQKVDAPIGRDPRNRLRMAVVDLEQHAGKEARTDITCWDTNSAHCLVHCKLHTGRTHQIRVHMLSLGHPLVADALYGGAPAGDMQRQALHAFRLSFVHPVTAEVLELAAEPPEDFLCAIEKLGLRYNPH
jgi:23S rRNA pseudouridine1911/1915/1917 synthase